PSISAGSRRAASSGRLCPPGGPHLAHTQMKPSLHNAITIHSRNHPQIKRIRALQARSERERTGLYYVEGTRFIAQAMRHNAPIQALVVCRPLLAHPFAHNLALKQARAGTPVLEVAPEVMHSIAQVDDPQGSGAVVR